LALSLFNVWTQTIAGQQFPPTDIDGVPVTNPLIQYSLPLLMQGNIARNYGIILLGLPGIFSLLPLIAAVVIVYLFIPRLLDRRSQPGARPLEQVASSNH